ncbi:MAG: site-specific DNA-methyltransferase [Saprospiraceae bacterium]|nr:site-specific DNA-methyltransferase [Saprospiraceae bacterium]
MLIFWFLKSTCYCDEPEFIYPDNYSESLDTYLEYTGQTDGEGRKWATNSESDGRYHSKWMNMMYPRLFLAKNLLREDGVIFISIDDNEQSNLKKICDELLGEENFISCITIKANPRGRQSDNFIATLHDYLLCYAKNNSLIELNGLPLTKDDIEDFDNVDEKNKFWRELGLRQRGAESLRTDRPDMYFPIYVNPNDLSISLQKSETHEIEVYPKKIRWKRG